MLYASAISSTPVTTPFVPTPILEAIFKRGYETPLASTQPIRVMEAISLEASWAALEEWIGSLSKAVAVWENWEAGGGWPNLRVSSVVYTYGGLLTDLARRNISFR